MSKNKKILLFSAITLCVLSFFLYERISSHTVTSLKETVLSQSQVEKECPALLFTDKELSAIKNIVALEEVQTLLENPLTDFISLDQSLAEAIYYEVLPEVKISNLSVHNSILYIEGSHHQDDAYIVTFHKDGVSKTLRVTDDQNYVIYENIDNKKFKRYDEYIDIIASLTGA